MDTPGVRLTAAVAGLLVVVVVLPMAAATGVFSLLGLGSPSGFACPLPDRSVETVAERLALDPEQVRNAAVIVDVAHRLGLPPRAAVIAVATAKQESDLRNLPHGDRDSLGLFQQRPSQGWGTPEQIMDPAYAATRFYQRLARVPGWQNMPLTQAAQAVQRSAHPNAYARWEPLATRVVATLTGLCHAPGGGWTTPVAAGHYTLTARFGQTGPRWSTTHTGLDFAAPAGTPVLAASAGTVTFTGRDGPYGNLVTISHPGGVVTYYGHLSAIRVTAGQPITTGQTIGLVGATGNASGPHLHFEVRVHDTPVDPQHWLTAHGADPQKAQHRP